VGRIVHGDFWVLAGAIADGGGTVAFGGLDGLVRLWKPLRGTVIPLRGHADTVTTVALSPNGKLLVTAGDDGTPRVWDAATGAPVAQLNGHVGSVGGASFSPDSREVVTIGDATARVWDALSGASIAVLRGHNPAAAPAVTSAGFDRDGKRILTGGSDGTYRLWDALPRRLTFVHPAAVTDAVVSPDGSLVLTAAEDGSARLWETSTGRLARAKREAEFPSPLTAAAFAPDGRTFAVASSDILVWPPNGSEQDLFIQAGKDTYLTPTDVAFPPGWHGNAAHVTILAASDHRRAAIWFSTGDNDPRALQTFRHRGAVMTAAYSPDGRRVLTASRDGTARVWSVASGKPLLTLRGDKGFNAAAYSSTGKRIVTAGADRVGRIWDARTGKELLELAGHTKALTSAAFSPDGSRVVTASNDKTARVWDARTGKLIAVLTDATGPVTSAAFGPGGRTLVTASADGKARLYPWRSFAPFARLLRVAAQDERVPLTPWERVEYDTLAAS
jgi:WD40 repeat protein